MTTEYHKNDPLNPENVIPEDQEKVLKIIDDVETPEQLAAAKELFLGEKPSETPEKDKVEGEEAEKPEEKAEKPEKPEKPAEKPEKPAESVKSKIIEITDDYISQADEKDRQILTSLKGEQLSEKALKNYVESQRLIGKKSTEINQLKEPVQERTPREVHLSNEHRQVISQTAKRELKKEFVDMPDDPDEHKNWLLQLQQTDPEEAEKYFERKREVTNDLTDQYKQVMNVQLNYDIINDNTLSKEVENVEAYFKDTYGLTLADIGLEVNAADKENPIINELLVLANGDFDPRIVQYYGRGEDAVPIIEPGMFAQKFVQKYGKLAVEEVKKRARKEGFESRSNKKTVKELTDISTEKSGEPITETLNIDDIENMDDLDKVRELMEKVEPLIGSQK